MAQQIKEMMNKWDECEGYCAKWNSALKEEQDARNLSV
jgi:hypothetical protein